MFNTNKKTVVHFIGVGGIGMSGIAEVLLDSGYTVTGSDIFRGETVNKLEEHGAKVYIGHRSSNVENPNVVVYSSAIDEANPEVREAKRKKIPLIRRAEMLAEIMRLKKGLAVAGTHGKTTTTSFLATVLQESGLDPTYIIGGIVKNLEGHAKVGRSDLLVAEADESDGSFLLLNPIMSVITNIDYDHLEHYGSREKMFDAFLEFSNKIPFYGFCALNIHDPDLVKLSTLTKKPCVFFGIEEKKVLDSSIKAKNLQLFDQFSKFDLYIEDEAKGEVTLNLPGRHNVLNALGAITLAWKMGVPLANIIESISKCRGVGRRFERIYMQNDFEIIDDYAHHPTEIKHTVATARGTRKGRLVAIFEPHRYSRTQFCWDDFLTCFEGIDELFLGPIYPASEQPIDGISSESLAKAIQKNSKLKVQTLSNTSEMKSVFESEGKSQSTVLVMGAGSIGRIARTILKSFRLNTNEKRP